MLLHFYVIIDIFLLIELNTNYAIYSNNILFHFLNDIKVLNDILFLLL